MRSSLDWPSESEKKTSGRIQNYYTTYNQALETSARSIHNKMRESNTARILTKSREDPFRSQAAEVNEL